MSMWTWFVIGYLCVGALFGEIYMWTDRQIYRRVPTIGGYLVAAMLWPLVFMGSLFMKLTSKDHADLERFKRDRKQKRDQRD